jgi:hypothetical protein
MQQRSALKRKGCRWLYACLSVRGCLRLAFLVLLSMVAVASLSRLRAASAQGQPTPPTCEQRLISVYGQYQQLVDMNGMREAQIRADYDKQVLSLNQQIEQLKATNKAAEAPSTGAPAGPAPVPQPQK